MNKLKNSLVAVALSFSSVVMAQNNDDASFHNEMSKGITEHLSVNPTFSRVSSFLDKSNLAHMERDKLTADTYCKLAQNTLVETGMVSVSGDGVVSERLGGTEAVELYKQAADCPNPSLSR